MVFQCSGSVNKGYFWLQEKALKYAESLTSAREMDIADGLTLIGNGSPRSARSFEALPDEPRAREAVVESRLIDSAADFLENHVIQFKLPTSAVEGMKRSLEEGMYYGNHFHLLLNFTYVLQ